jgi:phage tail-like protein
MDPVLDYPPVSFYFAVRVAGGLDSEASFQEASGLSMSLRTENVSRSGSSGFSYLLAGRTRYDNLVLKRGFVVSNSGLFQWCKKTMQRGRGTRITLRTMVVALLNSAGADLTTWTLFNAYPVRWSVSPFNSMENSIVVETLEFAYEWFTVA